MLASLEAEIQNIIHTFGSHIFYLPSGSSVPSEPRGKKISYLSFPYTGKCPNMGHGPENLELKAPKLQDNLRTHPSFPSCSSVLAYLSLPWGPYPEQVQGEVCTLCCSHSGPPVLCPSSPLILTKKEREMCFTDFVTSLCPGIVRCPNKATLSQLHRRISSIPVPGCCVYQLLEAGIPMFTVPRAQPIWAPPPPSCLAGLHSPCIPGEPLSQHLELLPAQCSPMPLLWLPTPLSSCHPPRAHPEPVYSTFPKGQGVRARPATARRKPPCLLLSRTFYRNSPLLLSSLWVIL